MLRSEKTESVAELGAIYKGSGTVIVTHYHGLTVSELTKLRKALRGNGASFKVVKNTLSKIATEQVELGGVCELFAGPTAIAYAENPVAVAKVIVDFAKLNSKLKIVGGMLDHRLINVEEISQIAKLPSLDQLRSGVINLLQAPATMMVRLLQTPSQSVVRVLSAYANKS
jgi:large subunit ribosomal protein L10